MSYIPAVAWGMYPGGTTSQIASYAASWGLLGDAPEGSAVDPLTISSYRIPTHPRMVSMPSMAHHFVSIVLALIYWWRSL